MGLFENLGKKANDIANVRIRIPGSSGSEEKQEPAYEIKEPEKKETVAAAVPEAKKQREEKKMESNDLREHIKLNRSLSGNVTVDLSELMDELGVRSVTVKCNGSTITLGSGSGNCISVNSSSGNSRTVINSNGGDLFVGDDIEMTNGRMRVGNIVMDEDGIRIGKNRR